MQPRSANVRALLAIVAVVIVGGVALIWWLLVPRTQTIPLAFTNVMRSPDTTVIWIGVGSCLTDVTTTVSETAYEVRIAATIIRNPGDDCPDILEYVPVHLDAALGDRAVIDASTGLAADVSAEDAVEARN